MFFLIAAWLLILALTSSMRADQLEHIEAQYNKLGNLAGGLEVASLRGRWSLISFLFLLATIFALGTAVVLLIR